MKLTHNREFVTAYPSVRMFLTRNYYTDFYEIRYWECALGMSVELTFGIVS
jgi:hypothetical protein